jgi:DNA-binding transcriptional MerR regulator
VGDVTREWTLAELVGRAARALADVRAPNGRVTGLPDARMIRWYSTIGIVDKPSGFRGRTALYGQRHLLQLVAVKRLQAEGRPLAEIQARLAGATEATLRHIAAVPDTHAGKDRAGEDRAEVNRAEEDTVDGVEPAAPRPRFWAARPAAHSPLGTAPLGTAPLGTAPLGTAPLGTVHGITLPGGATLLVPAPVHPDQAAAIRREAQSLLEYLSAHGLLNPDEGAHA